MPWGLGPGNTLGRGSYAWSGEEPVDEGHGPRAKPSRDCYETIMRLLLGMLPELLGILLGILPDVLGFTRI